MEAQELSLAEFIGDKKTFIIPIYQRNYDWRKEHCLRLFEDIKIIVEKDKPHFLGTIVYQKKKDGTFSEFVIVDGQQRITSVILLAKALCEFSDSEDISEDLHSKFIKHSLGTMKNQCKLRPTEYDRAIFEKLMNGEEFSDAEKKSKMYEAYDIFKNEIKKSNLTAQQLYDAIYKLKIVRILLHDEKPQEIFESLNSTGKDLTETELIRNFLLMELDFKTQENLYQKYWLPIERMLRNSEIFENFMVQYLVSVRKSSKDQKGGKSIQISKKDLYHTFKKYFEKFYDGEKFKKVEDFLADIYGYAEFYSRLLALENEDFETLSALDKKFYELLYQVKMSNAIIILMDLNNKYENFIFDERTFLRMIDALISFMFRAKVCTQKGANSIQSAGNILKRFEEDGKFTVDSFWAAITKGNEDYACPSDNQFKEALTNKKLKLSLKDMCKYLLYKLEKISGTSANLPRYENSHIQCVMPERLNVTWENYLTSKNDFQNHGDYVYSLGNLILTCNSKKDNSSFFEKRSDYAVSDFYYTKSLKYFSDWTSKQIARRTENLAKIALQVWAVPEDYDVAPIEDEDTRYNLDSDFGICTGKKPAIFSISGQKTDSLKHWYEVMRAILNSLCELDEKTFVRAAADFISTNAEDFRSPILIGSKFYVETNRETKLLLERIKTIVENFDRLSGTDFKKDIWFTLKNS